MSKLICMLFSTCDGLFTQSNHLIVHIVYDLIFFYFSFHVNTFFFCLLKLIWRILVLHLGTSLFQVIVQMLIDPSERVQLPHWAMASSHNVLLSTHFNTHREEKSIVKKRQRGWFLHPQEPKIEQNSMRLQEKTGRVTRRVSLCSDWRSSLFTYTHNPRGGSQQRRPLSGGCQEALWEM